MDALISSILTQAADWGDPKAANWARLQIGMLLEMHNRPSPSMWDEYEDILPLAVRLLPFNDAEQMEVVSEVCRSVVMAPTAHARVGLLSSLSEALPWLALEPATRLLLDRPGAAWEEDDIRQLLVAIDHMLDYVWMTEEDARYSRLRTLSEVVDRLQPDETLAHLTTASDQRISEPSLSIQKKLAVLRSSGSG